MNPADIIRWFREQAAEYNSIADKLEKTFAISAAMTPTEPSSLKEALAKAPYDPDPLKRSYREVSVDDIISNMGRSGATRVVYLATKLHAAEASIKQVIEENRDKFEIGERGWIRLKANGEQEPTDEPRVGVIHK